MEQFRKKTKSQRSLLESQQKNNHAQKTKKETNRDSRATSEGPTNRRRLHLTFGSFGAYNRNWNQQNQR